MEGEWTAMLSLGILMAAALCGGVVGSMLRLPKVTSFLLMGVIVTWLFPTLVPESDIHALEPLAELAISLVLFTLGCHFPIPRMRRIAKRVSRLSMGEIGATFGLVTAGVWIISGSWEIALMLGTLAIATAPATTILVLKETGSEGQVTEYTSAMVAVNNLASIVLFEIVLMVILFATGHLKEPPIDRLGKFGLDLAGSCFLGVMAGAAVCIAFPVVSKTRRLAVLITVVGMALGLCLYLKIPHLLVFLVMGITVANGSNHIRDILGELDQMTGFLSILFFVIHGASLQVDKLWQVGRLGIGYLILRTVGKQLGCWWAALRGGESKEVRRYLGLTMVAQAGAAITLAAIAVNHAEAILAAAQAANDTVAIAKAKELMSLCDTIQTVILGSVVIFEIAGPLLIRFAVRKAGEVPIAEALYHPSVGILAQLRPVFNRLLIMLGRNPWQDKLPAEITVREVMRTNIEPVPQSATFDHVAEVIEHTRENTFPVVDDDGILVGVLRYRDLTGALFEPTLGSLIRAQDVITPCRDSLHPDDTIDKAVRFFSLQKDDCLPVVSDDPEGKFLGMLRRRDLLRIQIRELG